MEHYFTHLSTRYHGMVGINGFLIEPAAASERKKLSVNSIVGSLTDNMEIVITNFCIFQYFPLKAIVCLRLEQLKMFFLLQLVRGSPLFPLKMIELVHPICAHAAHLCESVTMDTIAPQHNHRRIHAMNLDALIDTS